ncbi:MAG: threonylcarbamoyl-AMP synthase [Clostridia bacterium]|nr:threonylcarbamoyl-AMP synthase [Clostridia bacterium]
MKTEVISTIRMEDAGTTLGAELIQSGGLVAFPTETVYGLGANGLDGEAVNRIFEAKGRPNDNPLILHVAKKSDVTKLWAHVPKLAKSLMDTFWPGPLTLIFMKADEVPYEVTAGLETVAIRMPSDKTARLLIQKSGVPIAAPSANRSGRPSPTTAEHVLADMDGRIPLILDGGPCRYGVESTVLSLVGEPTILRPGAVTREMLEAVIGPVRLAPSILNPLGEREVAASPGMKYKHYAPDAEVHVVEGDPKPTAKRIRALYYAYEAEGKTVAILGTEQTMQSYRNLNAYSLGDREEPETLCTNLFSLLRDVGAHCDVILAEGVDTANTGLAFMNRLLRAAGFSRETV